MNWHTFYLLIFFTLCFFIFRPPHSLYFISVAPYTKFRNLYCSDRVHLARLASRESFDDSSLMLHYHQRTLSVQCFVASFYLLIFSTLLPAAHRSNNYSIIFYLNKFFIKSQFKCLIMFFCYFYVESKLKQKSHIEEVWWT